MAKESGAAGKKPTKKRKREKELEAKVAEENKRDKVPKMTIADVRQAQKQASDAASSLSRSHEQIATAIQSAARKLSTTSWPEIQNLTGMAADSVKRLQDAGAGVPIRLTAFTKASIFAALTRGHANGSDAHRNAEIDANTLFTLLESEFHVKMK